MAKTNLSPTRSCIPILVLALASCATIKTSDIEQASAVAMNRVHPNPSEAERDKLVSDVAIEVKADPDVSSLVSDVTLEVMRDHFHRLVAKSGAKVTGFEGDYTLVAELKDYGYQAEWKKPINWLFKSEEAMATTPGTCRHETEADIVVTILDSEDGSSLRRYTLEHAAEAKTETLDRTCPYDDEDRAQLLVALLEEALPCLEVAMMNFFAPRGFVVEHRRLGEDGKDIFKSTLPASALSQDSENVEVYRVQLSTNRDGTRIRDSHVIAEGRLTDGAGDDSTWFSTDVEKAERPLLEGDIVRPVFSEGTISGLNVFAACDGILADD